MRNHSSARRPSSIRFVILTWSMTLAAITAIGCSPKKYFSPDPRDTVVAIDVALEADRTPADPATAVKPHITLLQGVVRGSDLHDFTAAVAMVMATTDLDQLKVAASGAAGQATAVDPSESLRRLHDRMVDAFRPFAVHADMVGAFVVTPAGAGESALAGITNYVPHASGVNYRPHVAGASAIFKPMGAAMYQLDGAGNAQRVLWTWEGAEGAR
jgi:hypothetical protein